MGKIRHSKKRNFTTTDNTIIKDNSLTWKARGIFNYLWSMPDDWDFYMTEVVKHSIDGMTALKSGIKELEEHGYLKRTRTHDEEGRIKSMFWELSDTAEYATVDKQSDAKTIRQKTNLMDTESLLNKNTTKEKKILNKDNTNILSSCNIPYQEIVEYLNKRTGKKFKYKSKATQRLIKARWNEGFKLDDFKKAIDNKCLDWLRDEKMSEYLRPATLFGTKFESYLNQKTKQPKQQEEKEWLF